MKITKKLLKKIISEQVGLRIKPWLRPTGKDIGKRYEAEGAYNCIRLLRMIDYEGQISIVQKLLKLIDRIPKESRDGLYISASKITKNVIGEEEITNKIYLERFIIEYNYDDYKVIIDEAKKSGLQFIVDRGRVIFTRLG